ncbi:MAG TPA: GtrA family protein [Candidatus Paceibacterota bacterium]|nr:GtrA family protein [Candidatus Paceibacterota bacterium]
MPSRSLRATIHEFVRYGMIGVVRTLIGAGLLYVLPSVLGLNYILSNVIVYSIGLALGFFLHKRWAFRSNRRWSKEAVPYLVSFAVAYAANMLTLVLLAESLRVDTIIAQGAGMTVFILINYLANKYWTFRT